MSTTETTAQKTTGSTTQKVSFGKAITATITLTDGAQAKVGELLAQEPEMQALRIGVKPGGCSGFSYEMYFDNDISDTDIVSTFGDVKVAVDPESASKLMGSTLDYQDGLQGAGFHITNPNASSTCGCGSSFS